MPVRASHTKVLVISDRVYSKLLAAYPAEFRQRYGAEMAQVFRTCCRQKYVSSGEAGVLRLWLPTLRDWAGSTIDEWFFSLFKSFSMKNIYTWFKGSRLVTVLFFVAAGLIVPFSCMGSEILANLPGAETHQVEVRNQTGEAIRVTAIDASSRSQAPVRLYRAGWPSVPAFHQRNIIVNSGDSVSLYPALDHPVSKIYVCDLGGQCYVYRPNPHLDEPVPGSGGAVIMEPVTIKSLEVSFPPAACPGSRRAVSSPEYDYSVLKTALLWFLPTVALLCGYYRLGRAKTTAIPKDEI